MNGEFTLVTIVTVSYNAIDTIEETILSVVNQTYKNIEYIIIDGGSTDDTVNIIKKYADRIAYWVSEPDKGIYDAMNKGIDVATGGWINFMNSGDAFYSSTVIQQVVESLPNEADVIYGDTLLVYSWGNYLQKALSLSLMKHRVPFSHQSCFVKSNTMQETKYNTDFRICADYDFFYNLYSAGGKFDYLPICISKYEAEQGISANNAFEMIRESGRIKGKDSMFSWKLYLLFLRCYILFSSAIKRMLPTSLFEKYRKYRIKMKF